MSTTPARKRIHIPDYVSQLLFAYYGQEPTPERNLDVLTTFLVDNAGTFYVFEPMNLFGPGFNPMVPCRRLLNPVNEAS